MKNGRVHACLKMQLPPQCCEFGQILFALYDASLVARLVLATDQTVRRSAAQGLGIDIGPCAANFILDMGADLLGSSQRPALMGTVGEESG